MPRGGRREGAGRKKGVPNKVTTDQRVLVLALLDKKLPDLEAMIDETRFGIEIEKETEKGTVVGRLNADPKGAADLMIKLMEFSIPKLGRTEVTGEGGGPVQHRVVVDRDE